MCQKNEKLSTTKGYVNRVSWIMKNKNRKILTIDT